MFRFESVHKVITYDTHAHEISREEAVKILDLPDTATDSEILGGLRTADLQDWVYEDYDARLIDEEINSSEYLGTDNFS